MQEEDGAEFEILLKLHWFAVPIDNLLVVGAKIGERVASDLGQAS